MIKKEVDVDQMTVYICDSRIKDNNPKIQNVKVKRNKRNSNMKLRL